MVGRAQLAELIHNGENSEVEFKDDRVRIDALAKELVALANAKGGVVILGVSDDGGILGLSQVDDAAAPKRTYRQLEEWVMTCARDKVRPAIIPAFSVVRDFEPNLDLAIVQIGVGFDVHARWHDNHSTYYVRVGSTSREATNEELQRLFGRRGGVRAELGPIVGAGYPTFDERRLIEYFDIMRQQPLPRAQVEAVRRLELTEYMTRDELGASVATLGGLVIFGENPARFLPGATIEAVSFSTSEPSPAVDETLRISGPLVRLGQPESPRDLGIIETSLSFVNRHTTRWIRVVDVVRDESRVLPQVALREAVVNAVVHRDYALASRPILLRVFPDRVEVHSPGRLPNGITPENMRLGTRASRNRLVVDTLRDYGYVERLALGVPTMIRLMREFNQTDPLLEERDETFVVTLLR